MRRRAFQSPSRAQVLCCCAVYMSSLRLPEDVLVMIREFLMDHLTDLLLFAMVCRWGPTKKATIGEMCARQHELTLLSLLPRPGDDRHTALGNIEWNRSLEFIWEMLARQHELGLILTGPGGQRTALGNTKSKCSLEFILEEEGKIRGLRYVGPPNLPTHFLLLTAVQDVELKVLVISTEHERQNLDICKTVATLPCLSSLKLDLHGALLRSPWQIPLITKGLLSGCSRLQSLHLCLGLNTLRLEEVYSVLHHVRTLCERRSCVRSVYLDLSASFLKGETHGRHFETGLTGLSVESLTLDLSSTQNMLKGGGLLNGLRNLGQDTKFLGVILRDNDLERGDIEALAGCLTSREWDVHVDTTHSPLYYHERHLPGDIELAHRFLRREKGAFRVRSTSICNGAGGPVTTTDELKGFLELWK